METPIASAASPQGFDSLYNNLYKAYDEARVRTNILSEILELINEHRFQYGSGEKHKHVFLKEDIKLTLDGNECVLYGVNVNGQLIVARVETFALPRNYTVMDLNNEKLLEFGKALKAALAFAYTTQ